METEWRVARALRDLLREDPQASQDELAEQLGYSVAWVRKWRKRLAQAAPDEQVLYGCHTDPKTFPAMSPKRLRNGLLSCGSP